MVQCPSCARPQEPRLVCQNCGNPLPAELDCFAALGLPGKLVIDPDSLEKTYHELGRRIHPDRFAASPVEVRDASLRSTALLTRSYRTLRDPVSRGLYWLELKGEKLGENNKQVPPELAATVFEVQEQLADLRTAGGDAAIELKHEIERRRHELGSAMDEMRGHLEKNFAAWDAGIGDTEHLTRELKTILSKIAYLRTLIRDVDRELENLKAA